jgi:Xaa-Pro aminopeptidase
LEKFHQAAVATTQSGLKTMKAGMKMSEVIPSMAKTAKGYGFGLTTPMGHFVGLDLIEARVDADSQVILEPGVAMILHPRLDDFNGRRIILWGETYIMTERGPIRLTQTDDTLHTV